MKLAVIFETDLITKSIKIIWSVTAMARFVLETYSSTNLIHRDIYWLNRPLFIPNYMTSLDVNWKGFISDTRLYF